MNWSDFLKDSFKFPWGMVTTLKGWLFILSSVSAMSFVTAAIGLFCWLIRAETWLGQLQIVGVFGAICAVSFAFMSILMFVGVQTAAKRG